jgi:hypothetical protein
MVSTGEGKFFASAASLAEAFHAGEGGRPFARMTGFIRLDDYFAGLGRFGF